MLQRIQSLYLLFAALFLGLGLLISWITYSSEGMVYELTGLESTVDGVQSNPLTLTLMLGIALILASILMYKDRPKQMKFIRIIWIQQILVLLMFFLAHYQGIQIFDEANADLDVQYGMGVVMPLISAFLLWLASKAIKKDEDLVRSADRLR